jgi:WD40 repeat protein
VTASADKTLRIWNLLTLPPPVEKTIVPVAPSATLRTHTDIVDRLLVFNGSLFSASSDKSIISWNAENFQMLRMFIGHTGAITALVGMQDQLFSASADYTLRQWDIYTGRLLATMRVRTLFFFSFSSLSIPF